MQFLATDAADLLTVSWSRMWIFLASAGTLTTATFTYWNSVDMRRRVKIKFEVPYRIYEFGRSFLEIVSPRVDVD